MKNLRKVVLVGLAMMCVMSLSPVMAQGGEDPDPAVARAFAALENITTYDSFTIDIAQQLELFTAPSLNRVSRSTVLADVIGGDTINIIASIHSDSTAQDPSTELDAQSRMIAEVVVVDGTAYVNGSSTELDSGDVTETTDGWITVAEGDIVPEFVDSMQLPMLVDVPYAWFLWPYQAADFPYELTDVLVEEDLLEDGTPVTVISFAWSEASPTGSEAYRVNSGTVSVTLDRDDFVRKYVREELSEKSDSATMDQISTRYRFTSTIAIRNINADLEPVLAPM